jgi:pimeloyl-ACP methyl ester carboxylesterase
VSGSFPLFVLVPGLGLDGRSSAGVRARLPARVIPLPGMGRATLPVPPLDDLAAQLCRALPVDRPVVLIGHSQSCQVVAIAAADRRVAGIVLLGPTTAPGLRSPWGLVRHWVRTAVRESWRQVPAVLAQWWGTGPRAMRGLWRVAAPDDIRARLAGVRVPVVVVRGTRDALCPHEWAVDVAATAPGGRLVELPGAAHLTPMTHPAEIADILRSLISWRAGAAP